MGPAVVGAGSSLTGWQSCALNIHFFVALILLVSK
jgi:hypothetical protein